VKTTGGTANGSDCVFPFIYQGTSFSTCIYRPVAIGVQTSFSLFCSTTANLDQNGLWGYCLGKLIFLSSHIFFSINMEL
jgi:hypothetical protein